MASRYARQRGLSQQTYAAEVRYNNNLRHRLQFYILYFEDVVPDGVTVHPIPGRDSTTQEIQLRTQTGKIFMTSIISMEKHARVEERRAAEEAYDKYLDGHFCRDDSAWRFFTGLTQLRMFQSWGGGRWELGGLFDPVDDVRELATHLQWQYDSLRHL